MIAPADGTGRVLVLNAGSSSLKYALLDVTPDGAGESLADGLVERIGEPGGVPDHEAALRSALRELEDGHALDALAAVGHRVVHGGDRFADPVLVDDDVEAAVEALVPLAPLHNPAGLEGIRVARRTFPDLPQVAVFDTAFHQTLEPAAYTYAVPRSWEREHGVRRYGFHGTSYAFVTRAAADLLGRPVAELAMVVLHLGNGASATAVDGGRSVDTSMGLTPLEGLVMGTRSGDLDPSVVLHLQQQGLAAEAVERALNRESGMLGLAGANDLREVHGLAAAGSAEAALGLEVYCRRIRKYVGAYAAVLGRLDAVVFTAGVGEHDAAVRARSLDGLGLLGIELDGARNTAAGGGARIVSTDASRVAVLVVPTDEELEIARQALDVARAGGPG